MAPRRVFSIEELLELLDDVVMKGGRDRTQHTAGAYWSSRIQEEDHPLNHDLPDEPLVTWVREGILGDLRGLSVLDIGSGNGRNARWLASQGARVTAVDIAGDLLATYAHCQGVSTVHADFLRDDIPHSNFDLVYDSGCLHHIPPHRRSTYLDRLRTIVTRPNQLFGIAAFASEKLDVLGDDEAMLNPGSFNGYTFSLEQLAEMVAPWVVRDLRPFSQHVENTFAPDYLNIGLFNPGAY